MEYRIKTPKSLGDIVHLSAVATAMAMLRATAGDGFHKPAYDGSLKGFTAMLVNAARDGSLTVCNHFKCELPLNDLVKNARASGMMLEYLNDEEATLAANAFVSLSRLNQWGTPRGDSFVSAP